MTAGIRLTTEDFIKKSIAIHGEKYIYDNISYTNNHTEVSVVCAKHGQFFIKAFLHLNGKGCKQCLADEKTKIFIQKSIEKHGDLYDYGEVIFRGSLEKVKIICNKHGEFWQLPHSHIAAGSGCPACHIESQRFSINDVKLEIEKYGGELLSTEYVNNKNRLNIKCKEGHIFYLTFDKIKNKNIWCRDCGSFYPGEEICRNFLEELFDKPFPRFRSNWLRNDLGFKLEFDGYCEELGTAFEHNGIQHYKCVEYFGEDRFERLKYNDLQKIKICNEKGIILIIIPQLFTITPLSNFKNIIKQQLEINNITIPEKFKTLEINKIKISKKDYCIKQLKLAQKCAEDNGGILLSTEFIHSHEDLTWKCKNNHIFDMPFTGAKQGRWCGKCHTDSLKRDVSDITYEVLYNLHCENNYSANKISGMLKISPQIIRRLLDEFNIIKKKLSK